MLFRPSVLLSLPLQAFISIAAFTAISDTGVDYLDIGGNSWRVKNANGTLNTNATVPGLIHTDLYAAGIIPDPVYGGNCQYSVGKRFMTKLTRAVASDDWIAYDNWTYSRKLPITAPKGKPWSAYQKVYLVFEGLDTAAHVLVNGQDVGFANNQFRQWIFDVIAYFNSSSLELEVAFESAISYSQTVFESTGSPWKQFMNYADFLPNGREYIRKVQSDFGELAASSCLIFSLTSIS